MLRSVLALAAAALLLQDPDPLEAVVRDLADDSPEVRARAEQRLLDLGPASAPRLEALAKGADPEARLRIADALKAFEWSRAFPTVEWGKLRAALYAEDPDGVVDVDLLLRPLLDGKAVEAPARACFERLLEAGSEPWQEFAAKALAFVGDARSNDRLVRLLGRSGRAAETAAVVLHWCILEENLPALLAALHEGRLDPLEVMDLVARAAGPGSAPALRKAAAAMLPGDGAKDMIEAILVRVADREAVAGFLAKPREREDALHWAWLRAARPLLLPEDADLLRQRIAREEEPDRELACVALLASLDPSTLPGLRASVGTGKRHGISAVLPELLRLGAPEAVPFLRGYLEDEDEFTRSAALEGVAAFDARGEELASRDLLAGERADPDSACVAVALGRWNSRVPDLLKRPASADVLLGCLATIGARGWEARVLEHLEQEELWHTPLAIACLARIGGPESARWLLKEREHEPDSLVAHLEVAARLSPEAHPLIRRYLAASHPDKRAGAIEALATNGDRAGLEELRKLIADPGTRFRGLAIAGRLPALAPALRGQLEALLGDVDGETRLAAARTLAAHGAGRLAAARIAESAPPEWRADLAELGDAAAAEEELAQGTWEGLASAARSGRIAPSRLRAHALWLLVDGAEMDEAYLDLLERDPGLVDPRIAVTELRSALFFSLTGATHDLALETWIPLAAAVGAVPDLAAAARLLEDPEYRVMAIRGLAASGRRSAIPAVAEHLEDRSWFSWIEADDELYSYPVIADEALAALSVLGTREFPGTCRADRIARARAWLAESR